MKWILFNNKNINQYNQFIESHPNCSIWHKPEWLNFQLKTNRAINGFYFGVEENGQILLAGLFLILTGKFKMKIGYVPGGFLYHQLSHKIYDFFLNKIHLTAQSHNITYIQIDSNIPKDDSFVNIISKKSGHLFNKKCPVPEFTTIVPLSNQSEESILKEMKHKGRYNIKLAIKKNVIIKKGNHSDIPVFCNLLKETADRDGFSLNNLSYYEMMLKMIPESQLLLAYHENELIAAGIFTFINQQALYYYGASSSNKRNLMAPYLIQWEAIKIGLEKKCRWYDFLGIASPNNNKDPLQGVTDFKLKFGGDIVQFNPSYHIVHKPVKYLFYQLLKKINQFIRNP